MTTDRYRRDGRVYRPPLERRVTTTRAAGERAADGLEDLLPHLRELVTELRLRRVDAYASLYDARGRLSRLVRSLGEGQPPRTLARHDWNDPEENP